LDTKQVLGRDTFYVVNNKLILPNVFNIM
jgi:hypothetical protein